MSYTLCTIYGFSLARVLAVARIWKQWKNRSHQVDGITMESLRGRTPKKDDVYAENDSGREALLADPFAVGRGREKQSQS